MKRHAPILGWKEAFEPGLHIPSYHNIQIISRVLQRTTNYTQQIEIFVKQTYVEQRQRPWLTSLDPRVHHGIKAARTL